MMSYDHMRQASTPLLWLLGALEKLVTPGLNREGTKQKYTYQKRFPNWS